MIYSGDDEKIYCFVFKLEVGAPHHLVGSHLQQFQRPATLASGKAAPAERRNQIG